MTRPGPAKTIKCDMCKKEFPHNVDESILIHHVKTAHMNKKPEQVQAAQSSFLTLPVKSG